MIDEDLGVSGSGIVERSGFARGGARPGSGRPRHDPSKTAKKGHTSPPVGIGDDDRAGEAVGCRKHRADKTPDSHLLGLIEPDDIAQMALYLASDESRMVTGHVLPVDSGMTIS